MTVLRCYSCSSSARFFCRCCSPRLRTFLPSRFAYRSSPFFIRLDARTKTNMTRPIPMVIVRKSGVQNDTLKVSALSSQDGRSVWTSGFDSAFSVVHAIIPTARTNAIAIPTRSSCRPLARGVLESLRNVGFDDIMPVVPKSNGRGLRVPCHASTRIVDRGTCFRKVRGQ